MISTWRSSSRQTVLLMVIELVQFSLDNPHFACADGAIGTQPFMAIDLLQAIGSDKNVARLYRHDAESFAWVLLWICTRYNKGLLIESAPLEEWTTMTFRQCADNKANIKLSRLQATSDYQDYWPVVQKLAIFWVKRYDKQKYATNAGEKYTEPTDESCAKEVVEEVFRLVEAHPCLKFLTPEGWVPYLHRRS